MRRWLVPGAVLALLAVLFWWTQGEGPSPRHEVGSDVRLCKQRLRAIYAGLLAQKQRLGEQPMPTGEAFLSGLIEAGIWEDTPESRACLACPGPFAPSLEGGSGVGYVVGDFEALGLGEFPSGGIYLRAIVACPSKPELSHQGLLNVLYNDGSVKTLELERLIEQGRLPAGSLSIPLGAQSPIEELRVLLDS